MVLHRYRCRLSPSQRGRPRPRRSIHRASPGQPTAAGFTDRVSLEVGDAADPDLAGSFDLVCAFETVHDMCDPIGGLRAMRSLRTAAGTVLVVDELVGDTFTVNVD